MKTVFLFFVLAFLPLFASADTFGLGEFPEPTVSTGQVFGLTSNAVSPSNPVLDETICFVWPDGTKQCFASVADFERVTGQVFIRTKTVTRVAPARLSPVRAVAFGLTNYNPRWTVAGGRNNIVDHMAGWPHNKDVSGLSQADALALHDGCHDRIGPISGRQLAANNGRTVTRSATRLVATDCPTCPGGVSYSVQGYDRQVTRSYEVSTNRSFGLVQRVVRFPIFRSNRSGLFSRLFSNRSGFLFRRNFN